jgi:glycosyltransferase involved in cell wall biosynthesis
MRIAINALLADNLSGTGKYTTELIKHLALIDKKNQYFIFVPNKNIFNFLVDKDNFNLIPIEYKDKKRLVWEQAILPFKLKLLRADILHSPAFIAPILNFTPSVITIHDMVFKRFPWTLSDDRRKYYDYFIPKSIKTAKKIISVSEFTKAELIRYFPEIESKIIVTHEGVNLTLQKVIDGSMEKQVIDKYKLSTGYILTVGTIEPRKNISRLIDAYYCLVKEQNIKEKLVIVGRQGWKCDDVMLKAKVPELTGKVIFTNYIDQAELEILYSCAKIFILPSLYEGFGLPLLEAMSYRLPVITASVSTMPEIAKDAAIYVNPYNRRELKNAIANLLTDETSRFQLSLKSQERIKKFDWINTAEKTLKVYKQMV